MSEPAGTETMHLESLSVSGFRSCEQVSVPLQESLTLLVGENNSGKSNVIEALRLATPPLTGRRTRYFEVDDLTTGWDGPITLTTTFATLSPFQRAQYIGALDLGSAKASLTTVYHRPGPEHPRGRVERLAGPLHAPDAELEKRDQINHVYLTPLRDAQRELDSGGGTRLGHVMANLLHPDVQQDFVSLAREGMLRLSGHSAVEQTTDTIQRHMSAVTAPVREQSVALGFDTPELPRLARGLRLKMSEHGVDPVNLAGSGLGYANLLYLATVVLELEQATRSELTLFLVEEPEAHLHPQLQAVLLDYLLEQADSSATDDTAGPAGRIQVIATTHSPNLASSVGTNNIVVLRSTRRSDTRSDPMPAVVPESTADGSGDRDIDVAGPAVATTVSSALATPSADAAVPVTADTASVTHDGPSPTTAERFLTSVLPLAQLPLAPTDRRKVDQYLDVTRSELLFTHRVILVEGIAESVLIPALARHCVYGQDTEEDTRRRRAMRAASIISVGSVDFLPYLRLMLTEINGIRLVDTLVVVTDTDPGISSEDQPEATIGGQDTVTPASATCVSPAPTLSPPTSTEPHETEQPASTHSDDTVSGTAHVMTPTCAVGTAGDDSRADTEDEPPAPTHAVNPPYNRVEALEQLGRELGAEHALFVAAAPHTLEADLLMPDTPNEAVLRAAYLQQHPRSERSWTAIADSDDPADALYAALQQKNRRFLAKGQFAHDVAAQITAQEPFVCPPYLEQAIRRIVEGGVLD